MSPDATPDVAALKRAFSLDGKVALVTGGAGILGRFFCAGLAAHGAAVYLADIDGDKARVEAAALARQGLDVTGLALDVAAEASCNAAVDTIVRDRSRLDILHNNAASKGPSLERFFEPTETFDMDVWRQIMAVNLDGMFLMARTVGRQMQAQRSGSIIQTASIYGIMGPDNRIYQGSQYLGQAINTPAVYSASKAGVVGLTKYLATTWAGHGIRVNTLTPGGVESGQNETFSKKYGARVPLGRMAHHHDMVGALVFLASEASAYITGQNIVIDGGLDAW